MAGTAAAATADVQLDGRATAQFHFASECSTSTTGEPDVEDMFVFRVAKTAFRRPTVTLRSSGSTNANGIAYTWSTTITLRRIAR